MKEISYGHEDRDRDRGILTASDRHFLLTDGEEMGSVQARRNARHRIRNRIRNAIIDFDIIARFLSENDRRQIFDMDPDDEWYRPFQAGQKAMIEFLYAGLDDVDPEMGFETILRSGVHDAVIDDSSAPAVIDVQFEVSVNEQYDIEKAKQQFEEGGSLSVADIGALLAMGEVEDRDDLERLAELAREKSVIESSISPMRAQFRREQFDAEGPEGAFPMSVHWVDMWKHFNRAEPGLLLMSEAKREGAQSGSDGEAGEEEEPSAAPDDSPDTDEGGGDGED